MKRHSSPLIGTPSSKGIPLNMGTPRKIWCRIDYSSDVINETILIEYDEMDTIDDFKTKILNKLNKTRWASENDNASIAIGLYQRRKYNTDNLQRLNHASIESDKDYTKVKKIRNMERSPWNSSEYHGTYNSEKCDCRELESPVQINLQRGTGDQIENKIKYEHFNTAPLSDQISTLNKYESYSNDVTLTNNSHIINPKNTTSQQESTPSPKMSLSNHINIPSMYGSPLLPSSYCTKKNSSIFLPPLTIPYDNDNTLEGTNRNYITHYTHMSAPSSPLYVNYPSPRKRLKYSIQNVNDDLSRIIFKPDQLMSDIYSELFKVHGREQYVSEPLLIFSNKDLSLGTKYSSSENSTDMPTNIHSNSSFNETRKSTLRVNVLDQSLPDDSPDDLLAGNSLKPINTGDVNNIKIDITNKDYDDTRSINENYAIEHTRSNQEIMYSINSEEYLGEGVLLLPKGYHESNAEKQQYYHDDMRHENQLNIGTKVDNENFMDEQDGELSAMYKDSNPLFLKGVSGYPPAATTSIEISDNKSDLITPEEQDLKANTSKRILSEQEVGSSLMEVGAERLQATETYQPHYTLPNVSGSNSVIIKSPNHNSGNTLGVYYPISVVPTPLSTTFPVPLQMMKNQNMNATDISEKENANTSEKVFPKINVLIVEDNVINQAILGSFLRKHKISYKIAKNGKEAVEVWKEGGLHLIFMDLQLPLLSGIDAAKQIRDLEKKTSKKHNAPVIIVALTASNSIEDKRKALVSGCNDYLTKPVNLHWLSKKITEWGCMQALIDFDSWKQGQSRMTENVIMKSPHKKSKEN